MPGFSNKTILSLFVFIILCCTFIPCSADRELEVRGDVSPGEVLSPGQDASAVYTIVYDFDSDDESLQLYTDLLNPEWQFSIIIDEVSHDLPSSTGRYATLGGFELYYPGTHSSKVEMSLKGTAPEVLSTGNYTIFKVTWYDYEGSCVDEEIVEAVIVNPSEIDNIQKIRESELDALREYLDEKLLLGVDTASAEVKYNDAALAIKKAANTDKASASSLLSEAKTCIDESYLLADKAWAEFSIVQTESKIDIVEGMIAKYEKKGLSEDSRVWVIQSYIDNAETLIILARDKFGLSDYDSARDYAEQAESKTELAYKYASSLNDELGIESPTMKISSTSTQSSASPTSTSGSTGLDDIIPDIGENGDIGGLDDLIHSEVDLESVIKVLAMIGDAFMGAFEFLSDLISMASDN